MIWGGCESGWKSREGGTHGQVVVVEERRRSSGARRREWVDGLWVDWSAGSDGSGQSASGPFPAQQELDPVAPILAAAKSALLLISTVHMAGKAFAVWGEPV